MGSIAASSGRITRGAARGDCYPAAHTTEDACDLAVSLARGSGENLKQHATKFAVECSRPDPDGEVDLLALRNKYRTWCPADRRVPEAKIGRVLADPFERAGIPIAERKGKLVAIGATLKQPDAAQLPDSLAILRDVTLVRYKTGIENVVPLTDAVLQLLGERRKAGFVFTSTGGKVPFSGFSKAKAALDDAIAQLRKEARRPGMSRVP